MHSSVTVAGPDDALKRCVFFLRIEQLLAHMCGEGGPLCELVGNSLCI